MTGKISSASKLSRRGFVVGKTTDRQHVIQRPDAVKPASWNHQQIARFEHDVHTNRTGEARKACQVWSRYVDAARPIRVECIERVDGVFLSRRIEPHALAAVNLREKRIRQIAVQTRDECGGAGPLSGRSRDIKWRQGWLA